MREHFGNKDNYHSIEATFISYKEADDCIYLYITAENKSTFDSSESSNEEIRLELVGDNCDIVNEFLANGEISKDDKITVYKAWP